MFREMRRKKQALSVKDCIRILQNERRGVLAVLGDEGYPYAVPVNFYYDTEEEKIYLHCAKEGHKIDAVKACEKVCFTVWDKGVLKDGDWAYYVQSVVVFGKAKLLDDEEKSYEKVRKLGLKYYPTLQDVEDEMKKAFSRVQVVEIHIMDMKGKLVHER